MKTPSNNKSRIKGYVIIAALLIASSLFQTKVFATAGYQAEPVTVSGMTADIKVDVTNPDPAVTYYIYVGEGSTTGGSDCTYVPSDPFYSSPGKTLPASKDGSASVLEYTPTFTIQGTYCFGLYGAPTGPTTAQPLVDHFPQQFAVGSVSNFVPFTTVATGTTDNASYQSLAPLPGVGDASGKINVTTGIGDYINSMIRLIIGLIGVLSVLMIVVGGIQYMATTSGGEKEKAKTRMIDAILGLILALGSYTLLNTINPNLVNLEVYVPSVSLTLGDEGSETSDITPTNLPSLSTTTGAGTSSTFAQQILANSNIVLAANNVVQDSSNDSKSAPLQNVKDAAAGVQSSTSVRGDAKGATTFLNTKTLSGIVAAAQAVGSITITEIVGGKHSSGSAHYSGRAFDLSASASDTTRAKKIMDACLGEGAKPNQIFGPCNNTYSADGKFTICTVTGYLTNKDHQTHVHCGW